MTPQRDSFTPTRDIAACRDRVWAAWSDPALKRRWFVDHDGPDWKTLRDESDFRVGGRERRAREGGDGPGKGLHENETVYLDIAPGDRIVHAHTMTMNRRRHSASLDAVTFEDRNGGTRLTFTEQMTQLGDSDSMGGRAQGWNRPLDTLEITLKETKA